MGDFAVAFSANILGEATSQVIGQCKVAFRSLRPLNEALQAFRSKPSGMQATSKAPALAPEPCAAPLVRPVAVHESGCTTRYSTLSDSIDAPAVRTC